MDFDPDNYEGGEVTPPATDVESPTFTPTPGSVDKGTIVTINTATAGAYIVYSLNGGNLRTEEPPVYVEITEPTTIEAYAMKDDKTSGTVNASSTPHRTRAYKFSVKSHRRKNSKPETVT